MTVLFYALIASVLALAWWLFPHADEAQIRIVYTSEEEKLFKAANDKWAMCEQFENERRQSALADRLFLSGDQWSVADRERAATLRKVLQAQERKR